MFFSVVEFFRSTSFFFFLDAKHKNPTAGNSEKSSFRVALRSYSFFFNHSMAVEVLVALAAVLAAALAVRWARHHGPLRPRGAPPIFEGAPLVGGLLKFAKVSSERGLCLRMGR